MTRDADVVVVGGGPAGSTVALLLARAGRDVLLLDRARFPRAKACGECLGPGAVAALGRLGLADAVAALDPAPLHGWDLMLRSGRVWPAAFPADAGTGWGIDRARLDAALIAEAGAAGVRVREDVHVLEARPGRAGRFPEALLADGTFVRAPVLVGADGLRSTVARSLGAIARRPRLRKASQSVHVTGVPHTPDRGRLVLDPGRTLGLAPLDAHGRRWTLTVVVPSQRAADLPRSGGGLVACARERIAGLERTRPVGAPLGSGPFDWPVLQPVAEGVVLVGDAAGYFDPLTGQGIFRALRSAELAAPVIDRALGAAGTSRRVLGSYGDDLASAFRGGRLVQRLIQTALERPAVLGRALARLHDRGLLPDLVAVTGDARRAHSLLRPSLLLRLAGLLPAAEPAVWR